MNDDGQWLPKSELLHDRNAPAILDDVPNIIDEEDDLVMFQNCVFAVNAGHYAIITNPAHCDAEDPSMPDYVLVKAKELEETYLRHFSFGEKRKRLTVRELRKYMERRSLSTEPSRVRVDDKYVYIGSLMYEPVPHSPISTALFDLLNHVMPETRQRSYLKAFIASLCKGQIASPPSFALYLHSAQGGIGKSTLFDVIRKAVGGIKFGAGSDIASDIGKGFGADSFEKHPLMVFDEIDTKVNIVTALKSYVGGTEQAMGDKFVKRRVVKHHMHFVYLFNNVRQIKVRDDAEARRTLVLDSTQTTRIPESIKILLDNTPTNIIGPAAMAWIEDLAADPHVPALPYDAPQTAIRDRIVALCSPEKGTGAHAEDYVTRERQAGSQPTVEGLRQYLMENARTSLTLPQAKAELGEAERMLADKEKARRAQNVFVEMMEAR